MIGSSLPNENFNGISDDCFDDLFKFFDFPLEDVDGNVGGDDWNAKLQLLEPPSLDVLTSFSDSICNNATRVPENSPSQYGEASVKRELPIAAGGAASGRAPLQKASDGTVLRVFQTSSPVSVLESSSSCSAENPTTFDPKIIIPVKRARSKRQRPLNFNRQFIFPWAAFEPGSETDLSERASNSSKRKMRKKKNLALLSGASEMKNYSSQGEGAPRKCMHCEVTETPQWREGPMGPKTLCNACGVRYRSGRLYPEYRPAASPTFVASLHSNCHKKVIEMRNSGSLRTRMGDMGTLSSPTGLSNG